MTFRIDRPHRGPREASEFSFGGEASRRAGADATGCRSWLVVERDTNADEVRRIVRPGEPDPEAVPT